MRGKGCQGTWVALWLLPEFLEPVMALLDEKEALKVGSGGKR